MSTTTQPAIATPNVKSWAVFATELQQNLAVAEANKINAVRAAAENKSLEPAATQARITELNAAKSYNDFLDTGQRAHKLSEAVFTQLKTNTRLSPIEQLRLGAEQQRLDAAFTEFQTFKNEAGLKSLYLPPVYANDKIYSVDGNIQRDPNTLMGQLGGFYDGAKSAATGLIQSATLSNESQYQACVGVFDALRGGLVGKVLPAPGSFNRYQGAAWDDLAGKAFDSSPAENTCRLIYPKGGVPDAVRKLGAFSDGYNETLGALSAIDIDPALLAGIGLAETLSFNVEQGNLDASQAQQWLNNATGSSEFNLAPLPQLPQYAYQVAAVLPFDVDAAIWSDAGLMGGAPWVAPAAPTLAPDPTTNYTHYLNTTGAALSPAQQDALASQLQSLNLGATDSLSFITLPGGSTVIANVDGDIVGEISQLKGGFTRLVSNRINEDGSIEPVTSYVNPKGQEANEADYQQAVDAAQYAQVGGALGLMNSIIGLDRWDQMNDLQRIAAVAGIYNVVDKLAGNALPGDLGAAVSALGLLSALDRGDVGGSIYSGLALVETLTFDTATQLGFIGESLGAEFLPGLAFVLALDSGNPYAIASSGVSLAVALNLIPGWGTALAIGISLLGGLFGGEPERHDTVMSEGYAHAQWDAAGNTQVVTDQDTAGGRGTATAWMNHLTGALQTRLGSYSDSQGNGYGLIANMLPSIGFQYDPDNKGGIGTAQLILRWVDDDGNPQHRNYDRNGNRSDGSTIAGDFMTHAQGAIAPNWQVQTVLTHYSQGQGIHLPTLKAGLPQALADGLSQSLQAITLDLPTEGIEQQDKLIDIDGDGYLEQTQWLAHNQAVLAIDANGSSQIDAGELLSLSGAGLNALNWLDANGDQRVDAKDPAFAALRLWIDINGDGNSNNNTSQGETQTLTQAGITAIDFGSNPPQIIRADNSSAALTVQTLTGDILGVNYQSITGGVLQQDEQRNADGSLAGPVQTLHAINTRLFDGQAGHINGRAVNLKPKKALKTHFRSTFTLSNQTPDQWIRVQTAIKLIASENNTISNFGAIASSNSHFWVQAA